MKHVNEDYFQSSLEKLLPFTEIYVKRLEKNSIVKVYCYRYRHIDVGIVMDIYLSFLYQFPVKSKASDTYSIHF